MDENKIKALKIIKWNNNWLYRLVKLFYITLFSAISGVVVYIGLTSSNKETWLILIQSVELIVCIAIIFIILQKLFYYITFGTLFPGRLSKKTNLEDFNLDKHFKNSQKNGGGIFKWVVLILFIIGFVITIFVVVDINDKDTYAPRKSVFEICYDKCSRLGKAPGEDGKCAPGWYLRNDWCIENGQDGKCLKFCK